MFKKFICGVFLLGMGEFFSSCSDEASRPTGPTPEEEQAKKEALKAALNDVKAAKKKAKKK